jgi:hypothetical protein
MDIAFVKASFLLFGHNLHRIATLSDVLYLRIWSVFTTKRKIKLRYNKNKLGLFSLKRFVCICQRYSSNEHKHSDFSQRVHLL